MKPFELGKVGFKKNKTNPYKQETWNNKEWERGYNVAYFEQQEKLNANKETTREGS